MFFACLRQPIDLFAFIKKQNNQADESEEVKSLKIERSRLEDRLLEKDRSLKLSQQRLVDVKKALQKELVSGCGNLVHSH